MKWYHYLICSLIILVGVFLGIKFYNDVRAESYINGSIDISNQFKQETFNYSSSDVSFYQDADGYVYSVKLLPMGDFNGIENSYQLYLNDYIVFDTEYSAGSVVSYVNIDFYDIDGSLDRSAKLGISVYFFDDKTQLTLRTDSIESATYLEKYFMNNGCKINLIEIL